MALEYKVFQSQDNADIYYVDQGSGRPLVYVLGFLDTIETAQSLLARWSRRFRCVFFDHRGFGQTPITEAAGVEQSARDLHELLVRLDLHDVALVGYSMGGSVAFSYVEQFGTDRIGRLALVDTTPKLINEGEWRLGLWQGRYTRSDFDFDLRVVYENPPLFHMSFYLHAATPSSPDVAPAFPPADDTEAWLQAIVAKTGLRDRLARRVFFKDYPLQQRELERKYWNSMTGGDWLGAPSKIDVPTLCLYAEPGSFYSPKTGEWLIKQIPGSSLDLIHGSTHFCFKDKFEEFVAKLDDFFSQS